MKERKLLQKYGPMDTYQKALVFLNHMADTFFHSNPVKQAPTCAITEHQSQRQLICEEREREKKGGRNEKGKKKFEFFRRKKKNVRVAVFHTPRKCFKTFSLFELLLALHALFNLSNTQACNP
jgi:hypothetical protein